MKRLQLIDLVVHPSVLEVALGAPTRGLRDAGRQVRAVPQPASLPANAENIPPQRPKLVGILQRSKEEIPFGVDPALEFFGIVGRVVGNPELLEGFGHGIPPRSSLATVIRRNRSGL
jgi:hypothetical protein